MLTYYTYENIKKISLAHKTIFLSLFPHNNSKRLPTTALEIVPEFKSNERCRGR